MAAATYGPSGVADGRSVKRNRRLRLAAAAVGTIVLVAAAGSGSLIDEARRQADECWRADREEPGASARCEGRASMFLWIPKLVPWQRDRALAVEEGIERDQSESALRRATVVDLDRRARDAAIAHELELSADAGGQGTGALARAALAGAREPLARHADGTTGLTRRNTVSALLAVGDLDQAGRVLLLSDGGREEGNTHDSGAGALLCLLGHRDEGLRILRAAGSSIDQELALPACGADPSDPTASNARSRLVAELLRPEGARDEEVFDRAAHLPGEEPWTVTPWLLRYPYASVIGTARPIDPDRSERAGRTLAAIRDRFGAGAPAYLGRASDSLRMDAMLALAASGDLPGAARIADTLATGEHAPEVQLTSASVLIRAGQHDRAREVLDGVRASPQAVVRAVAEIDLALLELSAHRFAAAHQAARRAMRAAARAGADDPNATTARTASAWLLLATALLVDRQADTRPVPFTVRGDGDFREFVVDDRAARRRTRYHGVDDFEWTLGMRAVLPAVLYVLHRSGDDGRDPEVWVDRLVPLFDTELNGGRAMRARAEAARYRDDASAARRWDARADAIEARIETLDDALLARLAGL